MKMANNKSSKLIILASVFLSIIVILYSLLTYLDNRQKEIVASAVNAISGEVEQWFVSYDSLFYMLANMPVIKNGNTKEIETFLESIASALDPAVQKLIYVDQDGNGHYQTGEKFQLRDRTYYKRIVQEKSIEKMFVSPHVARSTSDIVVAFVHAVKDDKGNVHGALYGSITLQKLNNMMQRFQFDENSGNVVMDSNGRLFVHKDEKIAMNMTAANSASFGYKGLSEQAKIILNEPSGIVYYADANNISRMMFFSRVENTPGWVYGVTLHQSFFATNSYIFIAVMIIVLIALTSTLLIYSEEIKAHLNSIFRSNSTPLETIVN
ncbi:hypothetical protein AGMMS50229_16630 [Campylobacterota bacterium]|nr:hypothetical protein AGMMS50229_16630 [Campylobacterota bacterium]